MRILCIIDNLGSGGAQRQLSALAIGFKQIGHEVEFLTYGVGDFYGYVLNEAEIKRHQISGKNAIQKVFQISSIIRKGRFDAVLSFLEGPNLYCEITSLFSFRRNWKLIVGERSANPQIQRSIKKRAIRVFHFFSDCVVSNSKENVRILKAAHPFFPLRKLKVVYNLIDFGRWKPLADFSPSSKDVIKVVIAASHQRLKNLKGLVEALRTLESNILQRFKIEWYGDRITPPYFDTSYLEATDIISTAKLEGIITFNPATPAIYEVIQKADVVALFSFYEGMPNIICEGMACEKPILCSNISDIPLLLAHQDALLFDPYDISSIRKAFTKLAMLSRDDLRSIGFRNREIAISNFSKEQVINEYISLFQS